MVKSKVKTTKTKKPSTSVVAKTKATAKTKKVAPQKTVAKKPVKKLTAATLYAWNKWLALFYIAQGIAIAVLSISHSMPVTLSFLTKDTFVSKPGEAPVLAPAVEHLFDINLAYLVVAFLFVAAITHALLASLFRKRYEQELEARVNRVRWAGFGLAGGLMLVTIGLISGIQDISLLLMIAGSTLIAALSGLAVEVYSQGTPRHRLAYAIAWMASVLPWLVIGIYLVGANMYGSGNIAGYVYGVAISMLLLSIGFALNLYFQYKQYGKWADYLYAERGYAVLMFVAASALAWQVFAGVL